MHQDTKSETKKKMLKLYLDDDGAMILPPDLTAPAPQAFKAVKQEQSKGTQQNYLSRPVAQIPKNITDPLE